MLSVVVPAYKAERSISGTLASLVGSSGRCAEIIVVVDGVFDATREVASRYKEVQVIVCSGNRGASAARNVGLRAATHEYVTFVDADDLVEPALFNGVLGAFGESAAEMVFSSWLERSSSRVVADRRHDVGSIVPFIDRPEDLAIEWMLGNTFCAGAVAWRTAALRKLGGWNERLRLGEDYEVVLRSITAGLRVGVNRSGALIYVQHESPHRASRSSLVGSLDGYLSYVRLAERFATARGREREIRQAAGVRAYYIAGQFFRGGMMGEGRAMLSEARRLGFVGHRGTMFHRVCAFFIGLEAKQRLSAALHRMFG